MTRWNRAACLGLDPDAYFPERGMRIDPRALQLCGTCPVRADCLAYALRHDTRDGLTVAG